MPPRPWPPGQQGIAGSSETTQQTPAATPSRMSVASSDVSEMHGFDQSELLAASRNLPPPMDPTPVPSPASRTLGNSPRPKDNPSTAQDQLVDVSARAGGRDASAEPPTTGGNNNAANTDLQDTAVGPTSSNPTRTISVQELNQQLDQIAGAIDLIEGSNDWSTVLSTHTDEIVEELKKMRDHAKVMNVTDTLGKVRQQQIRMETIQRERRTLWNLGT